MSNSIIITRETPTKNEIDALGHQLLSLPFNMQLTGHYTVKGYAMYCHVNKLHDAYISWIANQNKETWKNLINAYGGHFAFEKVSASAIYQIPDYFNTKGESNVK